MELVHSGKVRELYADGDDIIMVASDRVSVYDVVLPTPIPGKGNILTQLSLWWFARLADVTPNHVISATDVPAEWKGRAIRCQRLRMLPVECVARGYLAGLGLTAYRETGAVSGVRLPPGLAEGSKLPEPVFTPTTKAATGHDEPMTYDEVAGLVGAGIAAELARVTLEVYRRGAALAAERGIIIADTKLEFGLDDGGRLVLADEVLTPDSSRFWPAAEWRPGRPQHSLDKQFLRDWSSGLDWDRKPPGPAIPPDIVEATSARYTELYERITALGRRYRRRGLARHPVSSRRGRWRRWPHQTGPHTPTTPGGSRVRAAQKYHHTVSRAWVELVAYHVAEDPECADFDAFAGKYPALLDKRLLSRHYRSSTLASAPARAGWVEPDLLPLPRL